MVSLIALIILMIGGLNWFCIGALQYDFVAGLFGSQANIFSRLVYVIVGISSIVVGYFAIRNKGKVVNFKKVKSMFPKKKEKEENMINSNQNEYKPNDEHAYHEEFEDRPGTSHSLHDTKSEHDQHFEDRE